MPDAQTDGSATTPRSAAFSRGRTQRMGSIGDALSPLRPPTRAARHATQKLWGAPAGPDAPATVPTDVPAPSSPEARRDVQRFPRPAPVPAGLRPGGLVIRTIDGVRRVTVERAALSARFVPTIIGLRAVPAAVAPRARWGIVLWALALAALIVGGALWLRFGT